MRIADALGNRADVNIAVINVPALLTVLWALEHVRAATACLQVLIKSARPVADQNLLISRTAANCASASDAKSSGVTTLRASGPLGAPPSGRIPRWLTRCSVLSHEIAMCECDRGSRNPNNQFC